MLMRFVARDAPTLMMHVSPSTSRNLRRYHNSKAHLVLSSGKTSFKTEDESLALSSLIPLSEPIEAVPQQSRMMNQYAGNEIWMKRLLIDAFTITSMISILPIAAMLQNGRKRGTCRDAFSLTKIGEERGAYIRCTRQDLVFPRSWSTESVSRQYTCTES